MTSQKQLTKGIFIVFEGIDGLGKTTQITLLTQKYMEQGFPLVRTKEPTNGKYGRQIREIEKHGRHKISLEEELNLFMKDREEHVSEVILPALEKKQIIVSDRYYYSTIAYQGALGMDQSRIKEMNEPRFPKPDMVILLDASPAIGISRIESGRQEKTNQGYEQEDYLHKVREIFKKLYIDPVIHEIDAAATEEVIYQKIAELTDPLIKDYEF